MPGHGRPSGGRRVREILVGVPAPVVVAGLEGRLLAWEDGRRPEVRLESAGLRADAVLPGEIPLVGKAGQGRAPRPVRQKGDRPALAVDRQDRTPDQTPVAREVPQNSMEINGRPSSFLLRH